MFEPPRQAANLVHRFETHERRGLVTRFRELFGYGDDLVIQADPIADGTVLPRVQAGQHAAVGRDGGAGYRYRLGEAGAFGRQCVDAWGNRLIGEPKASEVVVT